MRRRSFVGSAESRRRTMNGYSRYSATAAKASAKTWRWRSRRARRPERKKVASETARARIEMTIVGATQPELELAVLRAAGWSAASIRLATFKLGLLLLHRLLG